MEDLKELFKVVAEAKKKKKDEEERLNKLIREGISSDLKNIFSQLGGKPIEKPVVESVKEPVKVSKKKESAKVVKEEIKVVEETSKEPQTPIDIYEKEIADKTFQQPVVEPVDTTKEIKNKLVFIEQTLAKVLAHGPGSGETKFRNLDDVDRSTIENGRFLRYNNSTKKFEFAEVAGVSTTTGWALYRDTQYSSVAPLELVNGVEINLPNNAGFVYTDALPAGVDTFYDPINSKILPENINDYYVFTIRFKGKTTLNGSYIDFGINTTAATGYIFRETALFSKGAGTEHAFSFVCPGFVSPNFFNNGGVIKIKPVDGDIEIYDIELQVVRTHKA